MVNVAFRHGTPLLALLFGLIAATAVNAQTTTTTTTTHADGSTTTAVEETTTGGESENAGGNLIGPTGVTGTIRRSDRRQDRRLEEDLEDLGDLRDETGRRNRR